MKCGTVEHTWSSRNKLFENSVPGLYYPEFLYRILDYWTLGTSLSDSYFWYIGNHVHNSVNSVQNCCFFSLFEISLFAVTKKNVKRGMEQSFYVANTLRVNCYYRLRYVKDAYIKDRLPLFIIYYTCCLIVSL